MIVRLTYLSFLPGKIVEAIKIYNDELVPVVKRMAGNFDCRLLEPFDRDDDYISMTVWENEEHADAYQSRFYSECHTCLNGSRLTFDHV